MEDTLRVLYTSLHKYIQVCLNPCFNGRYSQSIWMPNACPKFNDVLILVLMEDTLRVSRC